MMCALFYYNYFAPRLRGWHTSFCSLFDFWFWLSELTYLKLSSKHLILLLSSTGLCNIWIALLILYIVPINDTVLYCLICKETSLWTGIKKGPPRKLKFPQPDVVVAALQEALKAEWRFVIVKLSDRILEYRKLYIKLIKDCMVTVNNLIK